MKNLLIYIYSLVVFVLPVRSESLHSVAIYGIEGIGISRELAHSLQEHLESNLAGYNRFRVISRSDIDKVLAENKIQQSGICLDETCLVRAGSILGVDEIITGTISRIGRTYNIVLKQISVESGTIKSSVNRQFTGTVDSLLNVASSALNQLITGNSRIKAVVRDTVYSKDTIIINLNSNQEKVDETESGKGVQEVESERAISSDKSMAKKIGTGALAVFGSLALIFLISSFK